MESVNKVSVRPDQVADYATTIRVGSQIRLKDRQELFLVIGETLSTADHILSVIPISIHFSA